MFITVVSPYRALDYESEELHCSMGHVVYMGRREILFWAALHPEAPKAAQQTTVCRRNRGLAQAFLQTGKPNSPGPFASLNLLHSKKPPTEGADTWKTDLCLLPEAAFPPSSSFSWM